MLQHSRLDSSSPLDSFRSSPVRGQLEAYDPKTPKGWRYIQTTDTANQLKVLLPPGTASMYEQLLKFEVFELKKKEALSLERILEIRHLKDRMIRKCHKLAKTSSSRKPSDPFTFRTIIAPLDFRVNAMERWFQQQQRRTDAFMRQTSTRPIGLGDSYLSNRSTEHIHSSTTRQRISSNQHSRQLPALIKDGKELSIYPETLALPQSSRFPLLAEKSTSLPTRSTFPAALPSSPPPLPHLLRLRNPETDYDLSVDPQRFITSYPSDSVTKDSLPDNESAPVFPKQELRPDIRRRRSCIKRSSMGDLVKTVSWADDGNLTEEMSKLSSVVSDVRASGQKWEEIREIYEEQMTGLEKLQQEVKKTLENIRSESEHLMRTDEMLRHQRSILQSAFQELEQKQVLLRAKVQAELEDTEQLLSRSTLTSNDPADSVL